MKPSSVLNDKKEDEEVPAATAKSKTRKYFPLPLYWICGRMWSFYEVVELLKQIPAEEWQSQSQC